MFALATGRPEKMVMTPSAYRLVGVALMVFGLGGWCGGVPTVHATASLVEDGKER